MNFFKQPIDRIKEEMNRNYVEPMSETLHQKEEWQPVPDEVTDFPLEASSHGQIRDGITKEIIKPKKNKEVHGYYYTPFNTGKGKTRRVNIIIAKTFHYNPDPKNLVIAEHINGDKLDNRKCNLRWTTQKANCHNTKRPDDIGKRVGLETKLSILWDYYTTDLKMDDILIKYNITDPTFTKIKRLRDRQVMSYIDRLRIQNEKMFKLTDQEQAYIDLIDRLQGSQESKNV